MPISTLLFDLEKITTASLNFKDKLWIAGPATFISLQAEAARRSNCRQLGLHDSGHMEII